MRVVARDVQEYRRLDNLDVHEVVSAGRAGASRIGVVLLHIVGQFPDFGVFDERYEDLDVGPFLGIGLNATPRRRCFCWRCRAVPGRRHAPVRP